MESSRRASSAEASIAASSSTTFTARSDWPASSTGRSSAAAASWRSIRSPTRMSSSPKCRAAVDRRQPGLARALGSIGRRRGPHRAAAAGRQPRPITAKRLRRDAVRRRVIVLGAGAALPGAGHAVGRPTWTICIRELGSRHTEPAARSRHGRSPSGRAAELQRPGRPRHRPSPRRQHLRIAADDPHVQDPQRPRARRKRPSAKATSISTSTASTSISTASFSPATPSA